MFTGIIEAVGRVESVEEAAGTRTLEVAAPFCHELSLGQSVAIDGACLTVTAVAPDRFAVEAVASTLERTVAARYAVGAAVNLERAARLGDRLDGHIVQGHVDGTATLRTLTEEKGTRFLDFGLPAAVVPTTILHGSITLNGVSLTVNRLLEAHGCQVAIIPFTWEHTTFSTLAPGDPVNVEGDMIGKYVQRILESGGRRLPEEPGVHAP